MSDEREPTRIRGPRPRPATALVGVAPVSAPRRPEDVTAAYRQVEHPVLPPLPTDAAHVFVRDVMTHPVHCLGPDDTLAAAAALMQAHECRHVPVVAEARVVGLVTQGDLARAAMAGSGWATLRLGGLMAAPAVVVHPEDTLRDAAQVLLESAHSGVPVVSRPDGRPVGFLSARDVLKVLVHRAPLTLWA